MKVINCIVSIFAVSAVSVIYADGNSTLDYFLISDGTCLKTTDSNFNNEDILNVDVVITAIGNYYDKKYFVTSDTSDVLIIESYGGSMFSQSRPWKINSIAVDYLNKKVYAIDELAAKINIFDIHRNYYSIILSDLKKPNDLVVDPFMSLMFFSQSTSAIYRANLDGTNLTKVIDKLGITAVTVDQIATSQNLYWATADGTIEKSDYFGLNRVIVLSLNVGISSLAVSNNNRLAYITSATWTSDGSKLHIYENNLPANSSHAHVKTAPFKDATIVQHYVKQRPPHTDSTLCDIDNGECQHLCLLDSRKKSRCACQIGWQLEPDLKTCRSIEEFVLYMQGDFVRGKSLDAAERETFAEAIVPIKLSSINPGYKVINFDYDLAGKGLLYTDGYGIYDMNIADVSKTSRIMTFSDPSRKIRPMAIDWTTGNVYAFDSNNMVVYNQKRSDSFRKSVFLYLSHDPYSLVVHSNRGYVFFTGTNNTGSESIMFYRINTDLNPSSLKIFVDDVNDQCKKVTQLGMALDYVEDRLYQLCGTVVRYSNLDGGDVQTIDVSVVHNPRSIAVYGEWIYVANSTSIWRLHKLKESDAVRFAPKYGESLNELISGVKVYSRHVQKIDYENNPCALNNGDCEKVCFAIPNEDHKTGRKLKKVCACDEGKTLQSDGTSCF